MHKQKKSLFCFFCQAADGIRAGHVTGVQTCALPISPACRYVPRFIAHALNQHVDEDGGENSNDDPQLVKGHAAAANARGSDLRNVVWRNNRRCTDANSANQTPDNELVEIPGKEHANGGKSETERAERKTFFLSQKVGYGSRARAADDASN